MVLFFILTRVLGYDNMIGYNTVAQLCIIQYNKTTIDADRMIQEHVYFQSLVHCNFTSATIDYLWTL